MDMQVTGLLFALVRSAMGGGLLTEQEKTRCTEEMLQRVMNLAQRHDQAHLVAYGLHQNGLQTAHTVHWMRAVYRYEQINYAFDGLCKALETARIPFIPLKGSVLRGLYPEPWMRTSCDIDVLVHPEDLDTAAAYLAQNCHYEKTDQSAHDITLKTPGGVYVELHFDLVEEGRANGAIQILKRLWEHTALCGGCCCRYAMNDAFFYYYHIAHMAKHLEVGGCGIRPFVDLWLLDRQPSDTQARDALLQQGGLLQFAQAARKLSRVWMEGETGDALSGKLEHFILTGGVFGTRENRVALQQSKKGGRLGYLLSRIFVPFAKLSRYYPILHKYPWLMPVMQVRRWFMLLKPEVASMAGAEMAANQSLEKSKARQMQEFMEDLGL